MALSFTVIFMHIPGNLMCLCMAVKIGKPLNYLIILISTQLVFNILLYLPIGDTVKSTLENKYFH